jgi:hypothetical protein
MNERIKELEKQCWGYRVDGVLVDGQLHFDTEKFAELIVAECVRVCVIDLADPRDSVELQCAKKIQKHFGVEK